MIVNESVVLLHNIGDLGRCKTVSQNLCLSLDLLHELRVFRNDLSNLALKVCPDFLLVLYDVLCLIKLVLQIVNLVLQLFDLVVLLLLEVRKHLLEDENLGLTFITLFGYFVQLLLHGVLSFLVGLQTRLHFHLVIAALQICSESRLGCTKLLG